MFVYNKKVSEIQTLFGFEFLKFVLQKLSDIGTVWQPNWKKVSEIQTCSDFRHSL